LRRIGYKGKDKAVGLFSIMEPNLRAPEIDREENLAGNDVVAVRAIPTTRSSTCWKRNSAPHSPKSSSR
jgi:hypothetical protein